MQFLRILLWVVIAVLITILASRNWHDVTVNLWGDIQADIKLPVILAAAFLIGFLPPYVLLRARRWREHDVDDGVGFGELCCANAVALVNMTTPITVASRRIVLVIGLTLLRKSNETPHTRSRSSRGPR